MKIFMISGILLLATVVFAVDVGDASVLSSCFSHAELSGKPADLKVGQRHAPDTSSADQTVIYQSLPALTDDAKVIRYVTPDKKQKVVALTFDMCELTTKRAGYDYIAVNALRKFNASATFFMSGKWMKTHPDKAKQIMADPLFEIGNHAWTHGNFGVMAEPQMRKQIEWTQAEYEYLRSELLSSECANALKTAVLHIPESIRLFRYPYGRCRSESLKLVHSYGLKMIQWNVVDGRLKGDYSAEYYAKKLMKKIDSGSIVLLHANGVIKQTGDVVDQLLKLLITEGYKMVTVSDLLETGTPHLEDQCYFRKEGDSLSLDQMYGDGTRHPIRKKK